MQGHTNQDMLEFNEHWPLWLIVHHFLRPMDLLRLLDVVVRESSDGRIRLEDICTVIANEQELLSDLAIQPIPTEDPEASALQDIVRSIIWENQDYSFSDFHLSQAHTNIKLTFYALQLSTFDFSESESVLERTKSFLKNNQSSLADYCEDLQSFRTQVNGGEFEVAWNELRLRLASVPLILTLLITKHFADICAKNDNWSAAQYGYQLVAADLNREPWEMAPAWMRDALRDINELCLMSSERMLSGYSSVAEESARILGTSVRDKPLLVCNGGRDALRNLHSGPINERLERKARDTRVWLSSPPLLVESVSRLHENIFSNWLSRNFIRAVRWSDASFKKSTALGSLLHTFETKLLFAQTCLSEFEKTRDGGLLKVALANLVESESANDIPNLYWPQGLGKHIDVALLDELARIADTHPGAMTTRRLALIAVLRSIFSTIESRATKERAIEIAIRLAHEPVTFEGGLNVGGEALEFLAKVSTVGLDLTRKISGSVSTVICDKLSNDRAFWRTWSLSFELAEAYSDSMNEDDIKKVVRTVLSFLREKTSPIHDEWTIIRPAVSFLLTDPVKRIAKLDGAISREILVELIRYGKDSESINLVAALVSWDRAILEDSGALRLIEEKLPAIVDSATEISSSASSAALHSLSLAFNILSPEQREVLIATIEKILLTTAESGDPPMGFLTLYSSILYLVNESEPVYQRNRQSAEFNSYLTRLFNALIGMWRKAATHPLIFTTFSFPPKTSPSEVLTYNWSYASIKLALALNGMEELAPVLDSAQHNAMLSSPILKARVTENVFLRGIDHTTSSALASTIAALSNGADFYRIAPIVLTAIDKMEDSWRRAIAHLLVNSSLKFGPSLTDCAVFTTYLHLGYEGQDLDLRDIDSYYNRVQSAESKEMQDTNIVPLLAIRQRCLDTAKAAGVEQ